MEGAYVYSVKVLSFLLNEEVPDFEYDVYKTDEYEVLSVEASLETYLWYGDRLFCRKDQTVSYRDAVWEELGMMPLQQRAETFPISFWSGGGRSRQNCTFPRCMRGEDHLLFQMGMVKEKFIALWI